MLQYYQTVLISFINKKESKIFARLLQDSNLRGNVPMDF